MVGRAINHPWPLLIQGGESFSWFPGARQPTGMNDCFENLCAAGTLECGSASYRLSIAFPRKRESVGRTTGPCFRGDDNAEFQSLAAGRCFYVQPIERPMAFRLKAS